MTAAAVVAVLALAAWAVLLFGRGFFWLARDDDRDAPALPDPAEWPAVAVLVPARNEEETVGETVRSVLAQDYPGPLRLLVVDDRSTDGTAAAARAAAGSSDPRFALLAGSPRPPGWTGKLWALDQGAAAIEGDPAPLLLLTDADIRHAPDSLRSLVKRALAGELVLASLMVRLRCESSAERWLIPAFVFFFGMIFPFRWVRDRRARTAAAAGGCVLLRRDAFAAAGGFAPIRGAVIDDCALARLMKARGPIWLGLTDRAESLRPYPSAGDIRRMVARTAYAQLGYSPLLLAGTTVGLALVFLAPPLLLLFADGAARIGGALAWSAMALCYVPTLRRFGLSPFRSLALPAVAAVYALFTLDSALAERRGRGGMWKGETNPKGDGGRSDAALHRATAAD